MKNFKVNDIAYGIIWFSELNDYQPNNFDFVYGTITKIEQNKDDKRVVEITIQDMHNDMIEKIYHSDECPLVFDSKVEMYEAVFKHERQFLEEKLNELNEYEELFNKNKEEFCNTNMDHYADLNVEDMK